MLERFGALDWERLARWVRSWRFRCLGSSGVMLLQMHNHANSKRLHGAVVLHALEGPVELNPFTWNTVVFLLHDSWLDRVRYLASWVEGRAINSQGSACHVAPSQTLPQMTRQLRQARLPQRQYKRALAKAMGEPGT